MIRKVVVSTRSRASAWTSPGMLRSLSGIVAAVSMAASLTGCPQPAQQDVTVPNVIGMTEAAARTAITGANLTVGAVTYAYSTMVPPGNVISQNPNANTVVSQGNSVGLEVSNGSTPVLSVSPSSTQNVGSAAGNFSLSVSNAGSGTMGWRASTSTGWLTITSGANGTNSGTVNVSYAANNNTSSRTGSITILAVGASGSPATITVAQAGSGGGGGDYAGSIFLIYNPPGYSAQGSAGVTSTGTFAVYETPPIEPPQLDSCFLSTGGVVPPAVLVALLDPGDPGEITVDQHHAYLRKQTYTSPDGSYSQTSYMQDPTYIDAAPGDIAELSWPGGADIEPFSFEIEVMQEPVFAMPVISPAAPLVIDFDQDLELEWDTGGDSDYVDFTITTSGSNGESQACGCVLRDDGAFTIPAHYLAAIKPLGLVSYTVYAGRQKAKPVAVALVDGGTGTVYGIARASIWATSRINLK